MSTRQLSKEECVVGNMLKELVGHKFSDLNEATITSMIEISI